MDATFDNYKKILDRVRGRLLEPRSQFNSPQEKHAQKEQCADSNVHSAQLNSIEDKLQRIDAALERIASEHYGCCIKCSRVIQPERLHNLPYAEYCLPCQREHEDALDDSSNTCHI